MRVSVIGGSVPSEAGLDAAREVGRLLGERGHTVVCGGLGGVMEAACRGASDAGGHTIGILPGEDRRAANEYVDTAIATGLGHARNALVVLNGDAVVAIDGAGGTLSEVGFSSVYDRAIAGIDAPDAPHVADVETPSDAVDYVEANVD
ncbi:TIGR00725 family protein [Halobacterium bonnevillei]|uniref:TIGR00725 family protein n=1 Tax=Halobacterium bonnevillei TaxID=2692200 RepID=A0A6B0ST72_9EURY|nr:TIGR00725 family protein [Halobacterium bonnevillei]MXR20779.1 TIGR00725 family protein [Halobacterium bonnevillei]